MTSGKSPSAKAMRELMGKFDPSADPATMTEDQKAHLETVIMAHIIPDTALSGVLANLGHYEIVISDRVTTALVKLGQQKPKEADLIWLCFSLNILLDIRHILRAQVTRPCKQMRIVAKLSKMMAKDYEKFLNTPNIKALDREKWVFNGIDGALQALTSNLESDVLLEVKRSLNEPEDVYEVTPDTPFSQNPVLSGKSVLSVHLNLQEFSMALTDRWWAVIPMAHLYNALKQQKALTMLWPRMEKLIEIQSPEYIFFGGTPTDLRSCHFKTRLAKGLYADMNASNPRAKGIAMNRPRRTFVPNLSPIIKTFRENDPLDKNTHGSLMTAINQSFRQERNGKEKSLTKDTGSLLLLRFVEESISAEIEGLKFNYWALN
jgi:hypothetical protein